MIEKSEVPMKRYWMGEDIETLPREKLIEIIDYLVEDAKQARFSLTSVLNVYAAARRARELVG